MFLFVVLFRDLGLGLCLKSAVPPFSPAETMTPCHMLGCSGLTQSCTGWGVCISPLFKAPKSCQCGIAVCITPCYSGLAMWHKQQAKGASWGKPLPIQLLNHWSHHSAEWQRVKRKLKGQASHSPAPGSETLQLPFAICASQLTWNRLGWSRHLCHSGKCPLLTLQCSGSGQYPATKTPRVAGVATALHSSRSAWKSVRTGGCFPVWGNQEGSYHRGMLPSSAGQLIVGMGEAFTHLGMLPHLSVAAAALQQPLAVPRLFFSWSTHFCSTRKSLNVYWETECLYLADMQLNAGIQICGTEHKQIAAYFFIMPCC